MKNSDKSRKKILFIIILIVAFAVVTIIPAMLFNDYKAKSKASKIEKIRNLRGIAWFKLDNKKDLKDWKEKVFKGKASYSIKSDGQDSYLSAYSENAASGLIYWLRLNLKKSPMIAWKCKVIKFPERKEGISQKAGWIEEDDYAVRFYVIFPKFPFYRLQCLEYVWDQKLPKDTILTNPNFKNLKTIVVESGAENMGEWVQIERNVYQDFKKAFGREPAKAGAIAIMTDSDNTQSSAEAQYKDIEVGYEK